MEWEIHSLRPKTLKEAVKLARWQESKIAMREKNKSNLGRVVVHTKVVMTIGL